MNRENKIQNLIKNGIIKRKEDSESIYYDTSIFTDKKWFELNDLMLLEPINEFINVYIINSKKGIGKTYQMRLKFEQAESNGKYFVFVRRLKEDIKALRIEWEHWNNWPYFIRGSGIYRKDSQKYVGLILTVNTLYSWTGLEFDNYYSVFFDEFKDKRGIGRYLDKEFNKLCKFLLDVQRNKSELTLYMFSNDETKHDPYTIGLNIDPETDYYIDLNLGVFYVNLKDSFIGAINEDTSGFRLGQLDPDLMEELNNNDTVYQDEGNLIAPAKSKVEQVRYYFALNKKLYVYGLAFDTPHGDIAVIKSIQPRDRDGSVITYAMSTLDYTNIDKTTRPTNLVNMVKPWYNLLAHKRLWFNQYETKKEIERYLEQVLGRLMK